MATPFSAPDEAIINEVLPLSQLTLKSTSKAREIPVEELYDTRELCVKIVEHDFRRIALQFPDELLCDASKIVWDLQSKLRAYPVAESSKHAETSVQGNGSAATTRELFVLADTSYGNCCVDEVAAEHASADVVIHFGHACLSPTARLPALYVFHKLPIDQEQCVKSLANAFESEHDNGTRNHKAPVLMYDVGYEHAMEGIQARLSQRIGVDVSLSVMDKSVNWDRYFREGANGRANGQASAQSEESRQSEMLGAPRKNMLPGNLTIEDAIILYVGPESLALTNLLLRLGNRARVIRYDATNERAQLEMGKTNRLLQRRYVAVQKARDAQTVALLVGTLGIRSYLPLLKDLRRHLTEVQGKRVYTISVGKLNPAKLANFQEVDVFVLIACPENSLVDAAAAGSGERAATYDSRDFFRPIVTPYELLTAFKGREWGGEYILDIEDVYADLKGTQHGDTSGQEIGDGDDDDDSASSDEEPHFSLVTGGLVSRSARNDRKREQRLKRQEQLGESRDKTIDQMAGVVVTRSQDGTLTRVMDSAGAAHVASRSWRGLEQRLGMDEAAPLEIGRTGIAAGYADGSDEQHEGSR